MKRTEKKEVNSYGKKLGDFISKFYLALVFIFLYAPIVTLMIFSFNKTKSMAVWGGFTFDWYSSYLKMIE